MSKKYLLIFTLILSGFSSFSFAEKITVSDLKFEGLQRITLGAALLSLPIREGDVVDDYELSKAVKKLYTSSYFESIELFKDGNVLIFKVKERPTISAIELTGNDKLTDEQILDSLKTSTIKEGSPLDRTVLSSIEKSLEDFYHSIGKYSAKVETIVTPLPRNRVSIQLVFREGVAAKIEQINLIGNKAFNENELLNLLTLSESGGWWDLFADDGYQKQKLSADLEVIKSYYLNRGYIAFKIEDTQVELRPNKKGVYVTVNMNEGNVYSVSDIDFIGDLLGYGEQIKKLVSLKNGDVYAASAISSSEQNIRKYFGRLGYAFPKINAYPQVDEETRTVVVKFSIEPGQRGYVRHINISGNTTTKDVVLRREMRQMENGWLSTEAVSQSRTRLNRLGFFSSVDVNTERVSDDLVDINVKISEQPSGQFSFGVGYGTETGLSLNTSVQKNNFLGSGDKFGLSIAKTDSSKSGSLNYTTSYLTADSVSGGAKLYYSEFDASAANIADYTNTTYGFRLSSGFPINETNRLGFSTGFESINITDLEVDDAYYQLSDFLDRYDGAFDANGDATFNNFDLTASWSRNGLDRGQLATQGISQSISAKVTLPGSDTQYYKLGFDMRSYQRITDNGEWTTLLRGSLGYGNGYGTFEGNTQTLPFFENYYVGGYRTVRGFSSNTIAPRALYTDGTDNSDTDSVGGNAKYTISAELIFPTPFIDEAYSRQIRTSIFVDAGEAWDTEFDYDGFISDCNAAGGDCDGITDYSEPGNIRVSTGVQFSWISPLGALIFTFATPLKEYDGDSTEVFSFNIGNVF